MHNSDVYFRNEWFAAGGRTHGPNVETVTMPEADYFKFRRSVMSPLENYIGVCMKLHVCSVNDDEAGAEALHDIANVLWYAMTEQQQAEFSRVYAPLINSLPG